MRGAENHKRIDLVYPHAEGEDPEELVLCVQGYIVDAALPPIVNKSQ